MTEYGLREFIADDMPRDYREYVEQSLKFKIAQQLVDLIWVSPGEMARPYCVEIRQEWRNIPEDPYGFYNQFRGPGQELTLKLYVSPIPVRDYIMPSVTKDDVLLWKFKHPERKPFAERIKTAVRYVFGKF